MALTFHSSPTSSLGVELELGLVDLESGELVCAASEIIEELSAEHDGEHPKIKHELFESTIEVITGVCSTVREAKADLSESIVELQGAAASRGLGIVGVGLHPFSQWHELTRSPGDRYDQLVDRIAWPVRRLMTHGMHVHVGVRSPEKSIAIVNALSGYLPILLALSASSPHWHGHDTGLASTRTKVFEAMPTTGLPPLLADWDEFTSLLDTLITAGSIDTVREIWWDIRPHPGFGTVELRMCDAPPTLGEVAALAALSQCLVQRFDDLMEAGQELPVPREWVRRENKWRAARWGIECQLVVDDQGHTRPFTDVVSELIDDLMPVARALDCVDELQDVARILQVGPSYVRQRALIENGGDLIDVVASLRQELMTETSPS